MTVDFAGFSQTAGISRNWTSFVQSLDASFLNSKVKFKLTAAVKVITNDSLAYAGILIRVEDKNGEARYVDNSESRIIRTNEWRTYSVEGTLDENSDKIHLGGYCVYNGKFYFDNIEFFVENKAGELEKVPLDNSDFETPVFQRTIPGWTEGTKATMPVKVRDYSISSGEDSPHGKYSLLIEGKSILPDTTYLIGPVNGFTPQIGTLVTMLNNLSTRVEEAVQLLNQQETDHLLDEKANSIGALIMHLTAAEAYYQVYTFENREFNDEEKKKWQAGLDLGEEARRQFKGKDISYYLDIYREVRRKTIEELSKRNDEWLAKTEPGMDFNNHFSWFHVMEHQSSHLGQILLLKKRLPERKEKPAVRVDYDR